MAHYGRYCHKRCMENNDIFKKSGGGESDPFYNCPAGCSFSLYQAGEQNALATPKIFISCYFQCLSGMNSEPTNPIQGAYSRFFLAHIVTTFTGPSVTFFCLPASHVLWADQDFALTFHGSFGTSATRALTNSELPELRHARPVPQNIEVRNSAGTSWRLWTRFANLVALQIYKGNNNLYEILSKASHQPVKKRVQLLSFVVW